MNVDRLRQLILERAIQGKLVPQLDDEPASKQIGPVPEGVPFEIPEKWKWCCLSSVFELKAGKFISASEISDKGPYLCYGGNGVRGRVQRFNREGRYPLIGRQGALCGNINIAEGSFYATEHAVVADSQGKMDVDCAAWFLSFLNLNQYATKTAQPGLSVKRISKIAFPLPPILEQRRIVARVKELLVLVDTYEKNQSELERLGELLKASILQQAIQGKLVPQLDGEPAVEQIGKAPEEVPFEIPEKWKWVRLKELVSPAKQKVPDKIFTYIDVSSISRQKINAPKILEASGAPSRARKVVQEGMVLYATVRPYLLNTCIVPHLSGEVIASTAFAAVECKNQIYNEYLLGVLLSGYFVSYVKSVQKGISYPAITDKDFYKALIPLPPVSEQRRIVARVKELLALVDGSMKSS